MYAHNGSCLYLAPTSFCKQTDTTMRDKKSAVTACDSENSENLEPINKTGAEVSRLNLVHNPCIPDGAQHIPESPNDICSGRAAYRDGLRIGRAVPELTRAFVNRDHSRMAWVSDKSRCEPRRINTYIGRTRITQRPERAI